SDGSRRRDHDLSTLSTAPGAEPPGSPPRRELTRGSVRGSAQGVLELEQEPVGERTLEGHHAPAAAGAAELGQAQERQEELGEDDPVEGFAEAAVLAVTEEQVALVGTIDAELLGVPGARNVSRRQTRSRMGLRGS